MNKSILLLPLLVAGLAKSQEGRVGINTVSPKTTLDVNGKSDTNGLSLSGDITGLQAPRLTRAELTNKGNALYGTDQRGAIVYITDVSGGDNVSQRVNIISVGYYYFDGAVWNRIASNSGALLNPVTSDNGLTKTGDNIQLGGTLIKNTDIATAGFNTTFSGTGNVGIGTTLPTQKLEVVGNGKFIASNNLVEAVVNAPSSGLNLIKNGTANLSNSTVMGFLNFGGRINNTDNQSMSTIVGEYKGNGTNNLSNLQFRTSGVVDNDMILSESGDLGVGTSISPTQKLDVDGNVRFRQVPENASIDTNDRVMVLDNTGVAKKVPLSSVQSTVTSDNGLTKTGNNVQLGGTLLKNTDIATAGFNTTFSGTGKVGIGNNNPDSSLHVSETSAVGSNQIKVESIITPPRLVLERTGTSNLGNSTVLGEISFNGRVSGADFPLAGIKSNYWGDGSTNSSSLTLRTSDSDQVLINEFGNTGFGTVGPTQKLDVNGNVRFRSVPISSSVASGESIMVLQADGTAKKVELSALQQSLSKFYFLNYSLNDPQGDFISNFDTRIPVANYEVAVIGFSTTHRSTANGAFINNNATAGLFQSPDIFAFEENGTWRLRADMPNATTTYSQPNFSWIIRVIVISKNQSVSLPTQVFNFGGSSTGAATSSPVP
ncbi:hypothetical protein AR438_11715 [Chryseobacterium aquaticum]|uniref:Uncharacterized protein n=1 Tax=Chryseobacterium aquaticum TaxID=452084 RepID=A0A0Q3KM14_9FLAO|nr:hypothetical protein [Chryseobacterium aquaticum]KQK25188.1 hypothetical protein AR438_11715 [Chryseobacterium aquaticum]